VDNTKMGPYRALAQVAYAASQKGEYATAAALAKALERTWDKAQDYGGDMALFKTNHALFEDIADPAGVKTAYNAYLEKLKQAD
jgi:hypothetical protein